SPDPHPTLDAIPWGISPVDAVPLSGLFAPTACLHPGSRMHPSRGQAGQRSFLPTTRALASLSEHPTARLFFPWSSRAVRSEGTEPVSRFPARAAASPARPDRVRDPKVALSRRSLG